MRRVSSSSFFLIQDIASQLSSDCLDTCLTRTYNAFIAHCKFVEPANLKHLKFLMDSVVEIYSLNIQKSYQKVLLSVQQLASILRQALKTKEKVCDMQPQLISSIWFSGVPISLPPSHLYLVCALCLVFFGSLVGMHVMVGIDGLFYCCSSIKQYYIISMICITYDE